MCHGLGGLGRMNVHRTGRRVLEFFLIRIERRRSRGLNEPIPQHLHHVRGLWLGGRISASKGSGIDPVNCEEGSALG